MCLCEISIIVMVNPKHIDYRKRNIICGLDLLQSESVGRLLSKLNMIEFRLL
jgi:hypothetical protein